MGEMTDKIVNLEEDSKSKEILQEISELRAANTELRKQTRNKGIPINVRDDLFATIETNKDRIEELLASLNKPTIVPITKVPIVADHKYEDTSTFSRSSVRF